MGRGYKKFLDPPTHTNNFLGGIKKFLDGYDSLTIRKDRFSKSVRMTRQLYYSAARRMTDYHFARCRGGGCTGILYIYGSVVGAAA